MSKFINKKSIFFSFLAVIAIAYFYFFDIYKIIDERGKKHLYLINKQKNIQRGDFVVVENPTDSTTSKIRAIAVPNDIVEIKNGEIFVNNKILDIVRVYKYRVNCFSNDATKLLKEKYHYITEPQILGVYDLLLTPKQADSLRQDSIFIIKRYTIDSGYGDEQIFPQSFRYRWNKDNFGKYQIISKGTKIQLNEQNYSLFRNTILWFEGQDIKRVQNKYTIDNQEITEYTFKNNYYFLLNDNHENIRDSRAWGAVPEYLIKGVIIKEF